ncbi:MAG: DUF4375 domain-containing protein [Planctomycetota bacterium]
MRILKLLLILFASGACLRTLAQDDTSGRKVGALEQAASTRTAKSMDPYLQRLFDSPDDFQLIDGLWSRIAQLSDGADLKQLQRLKKEHKVVLDVWGAKGIIDNGGFQYLFESGLADFGGIADSFETVGIQVVANAIREALAIFPDSHPHADVDKRLQYLNDLGAPAKKTLESLSEIVWESNVETLRKLGSFVRSHQNAFCKLQPTQWEDIRKLDGQDLEPPELGATNDDIVLWLESIDARCKRMDEWLTYESDQPTAPLDCKPIVYIRLSDKRNSTDAELELLSKYTALQELRVIELNETLITEQGIKQLASFPNLQVVVLRGTQVQDHWLVPLDKCRKLKNLDLTNTAVTSQCCQVLAKLKTIETLSFWNTRITDGKLGELAVLPKLKSIDLGDTSLTGVGLHSFNVIPLEELYLRLTAVSDNGLKSIGTLKNLKVVHLEETSIGDATLERLAQCTQLEELDASYTAITDAGVLHLEKLRELHSLNLGHTAVSDVGLTHIAKLPKLRELYLTDTAITPGAGLLVIGDLKSLEHLALPEHFQGKSNVRKLQDRLSRTEFSFY